MVDSIGYFFFGKKESRTDEVVVYRSHRYFPEE